MKTTRSLIVALGICGATLALWPQPGEGGEQGMYFKLDAGVALPQSVSITSQYGQPLPTTFFVEGLPVAIDQPTLKLGTGARVDLIGGYSFSKSLALELETGFVYNPVDKITVSGSVAGLPFSDQASLPDMSLWQVPILANVVYTVPLESKFKPFIGGGVGGVWSVLTEESIDGNDFTFAFQAFAGLNYAVSDNVDIGLVYQFLGTLDHDFGHSETGPFYTSSILAMFTLRF